MPFASNERTKTGRASTQKEDPALSLTRPNKRGIQEICIPRRPILFLFKREKKENTAKIESNRIPTRQSKKLARTHLAQHKAKAKQKIDKYEKRPKKKNTGG